MLNSSLMADLGKLSGTLQKINQVHGAIAKIYTALDESSRADTHGTIGGVFEKISLSCKELREIVNQDFGKFFRHYKYELNSMEELLHACGERKQNLEKGEKKLRDKKETLFNQQLVAKWDLEPGCPITIDTLLKNKVIAFKEMLPGETHETHKLKVNYGYYCNKVLEEFMRINKKDDEEVRDYFIKVAKKSCDIFEDINVMWADMVAHFARIQDHVDTSDEKIVQAHAELPQNIFEKKGKTEAGKP